MVRCPDASNGSRELHAVTITHSFSVLKEMELRREEGDSVQYHALWRDRRTGRMAYDTSSSYLGMTPNLIEQSISDLFDREVQRTVGGLES